MIFCFWRSKKLITLNFIRNLVGVPNLKHQLLLVMFILIIFLKSDLNNPFAIIISSNHLGILQRKSIKEIIIRLLIINQHIQTSSLNLKLLTLIIFDEVLITIDEGISEVRMNLVNFLKSTVLEASNQRMLVQSIKFFNHSVLNVLFWFTNKEFQEVLVYCWFLVSFLFSFFK
jgi:hypothetical protein